MGTEEAKTCPSAACSKSASLMGIVQADKTVALLDTPLKLNESFIENARQYGEPEQQFRFSDKCIKSGCGQWTGQNCGIISELTAANPSIKDASEDLPPCFIRRTCRWFSQEGRKACKICLFVVTQSGENAVAENA